MIMSFPDIFPRIICLIIHVVFLNILTSSGIVLDVGAQKGEKVLSTNCSNGIRHTKATVTQCAGVNKVFLIQTEAWEY